MVGVDRPRRTACAAQPASRSLRPCERHARCTPRPGPGWSAPRFDAFNGADTVVSHAIETPEFGEEIERAIVGGTGDHAGAAGTQVQVLESFNDSEGVDLTVALEAGDA